VKSARHSDSCYANLDFRPQDRYLLYRFLCYNDLKIVARVNVDDIPKALIICKCMS